MTRTWTEVRPAVLRVALAVAGAVAALAAHGQAAVEYGTVGTRTAPLKATAPQPAAAKPTAQPGKPGSPAAAQPAALTTAATPAPQQPRVQQPRMPATGNVEMAPQVFLAEGKSTLMRLPYPASRLSVGDASVADVILLNPSEVYMLGKSIGTTNLMMWNKSNDATIIDIAVGLDTAALHSRIVALMPEEKDIKITTAADTLILSGTVSDGEGRPVRDALLELWQADADGTIPRAAGSLHRDGWTFTGWGRASTDDGGRYGFSTVVPGASNPGAAPYFLITVFARGLLNRLFTRAYVPGEALAADPLLVSLPQERRETLIAEPTAAGLRFDIQLQEAPGKPETVFLRYPGHQR